MLALAVGVGGAQAPDPIDRIREADLKADLFMLAGDAMRGREGGTLDEMAASVWLAERAREAGLQPAGDNGTYFQFFPLERFRVSASSQVTLGGKPLRMGRDVVPDATVLANVDAPVTIAPSDVLTGSTIKDRVLVVRYAPVAPAGRAGAGAAQLAASDSEDGRRGGAGCDRRDRARSRPVTNGSVSPFRSRAAPTRWIRTAPPSRARPTGHASPLRAGSGAWRAAWHLTRN